MLPKEHRLKDKKEIETVFQRGRLVFSHFLFLKYLPNQKHVSRVAFSVGLKFSKKAVERNRVKRILRAVIYRELPGIISGYDLVFYIKDAKKELVTTPIIRSYVSEIFSRARLKATKPKI